MTHDHHNPEHEALERFFLRLYDCETGKPWTEGAGAQEVVNRMRLAALDEYCALSGRSKEGLIAELEARETA